MDGMRKHKTVENLSLTIRSPGYWDPGFAEQRPAQVERAVSLVNAKMGVSRKLIP